MIHVTTQAEPANFDADVRLRGLAHLRRKRVALDMPLPPKTKIQPYWRACLDDLYANYQGVCAYIQFSGSWMEIEKQERVLALMPLVFISARSLINRVAN